jgi:DNA-nicking Smr family endonuclease
MSKRRDERKDGKGEARQNGGLSAEDAALWRFVTRDVRPTRGKARVSAVEASRARGEKASAKPASAAQSPRAPASAEARAKGVRVSHAAAGSMPKPATTAAPVEFERRKSRRIARGAEEIEARLDLHGMTQSEAHRALTHFIHQCQSKGMKTVLVITGKGRAGDEQASGSASRGRGVLRQNVPRWINEPGLAGLVVGYAAAGLRHGGDGALYVRLRRRR